MPGPPIPYAGGSAAAAGALAPGPGWVLSLAWLGFKLGKADEAKKKAEREAREQAFKAKVDRFLSSFGEAAETSEYLHVSPGLAYAPIASPMVRARDIIEYLIITYSPKTSSDFITDNDFGSLGYLQALLNTEANYHATPNNYGTNYEMRFTLIEQTELEVVMMILCRNNMPGVQIYEDEDGKIRVVKRLAEPDITNSDYVYPRALKYNQDTIGDSFRINHGNTEDIITGVTIDYGWDYSKNKFARRAYCDECRSDDGYGLEWAAALQETATSPELLCGGALQNAGKKQQIEIMAPYLYEPSPVIAIGNNLITHNYRVLRVITFDGQPGLYDLYPGMYCYWDDDSFPDHFGFPINSTSTSDDTPWAHNLWYVESRTRVQDDLRGIYYEFELELAPNTIGIEGKEGMAPGRGFKRMAQFPG